MLRVYDKCNLHIEASNVIVRPREIKSIHLKHYYGTGNYRK